MKEIVKQILKELDSCLEKIDEQKLMKLELKIQKSNRIFVAGAGRSLLMIRAFAMRLMHMGFTSYVVGETITPAIESNDLLIIASGSGNTSTLIVMAEKCKQVGADLVLITTNADSKIAKLSNLIIQINAVSTKKEENQNHSIQLVSNTFEQCFLLIMDALVTDIVSKASIEENNTYLMKRHANLE